MESKAELNQPLRRAQAGQLPIHKILGEKVRRRAVIPRIFQAAEERVMLDEAKAAVATQENCETYDGRLVRTYSPLEADQAMFEIETNKGSFFVIRDRGGAHTIIHKHEAEL